VKGVGCCLVGDSPRGAAATPFSFTASTQGFALVNPAPELGKEDQKGKENRRGMEWRSLFLISTERVQIFVSSCA
jgi:hypothetical protein